MDMTKIAVFRMTTGKMGWLAERQRILSQNVANSDTPKYQPKDLKSVDFRRMVQKSEGVNIARTHRGHMSLGSESQKYQAEKSRDTYETSYM